MSLQVPQDLQSYHAAIVADPDQYLESNKDNQAAVIDNLANMISVQTPAALSRFLECVQFTATGTNIHPVSMNVPADDGNQMIQLLSVLDNNHNTVRFTEYGVLAGDPLSIQQYDLKYTNCKDAIEGINLNFFKTGYVDHVSLCIESTNEHFKDYYLPSKFKRFASYIPIITVNNPAPGLIRFGDKPIHMDPYRRYTILVKYSSTHGFSVRNTHVQVQMRYISVQCLAYSFDHRRDVSSELSMRTGRSL